MQGQSTQPVKVRSKEVSVHLGSYPGDGEGDRPVEASGTEIRLGRVSERTGRNAGDWQHGRPVARPGRPGTGPFGGRARQASEGPIVPMKLGNASGGKGPWFGVRSDEPRGGGLA